MVVDAVDETYVRRVAPGIPKYTKHNLPHPLTTVYIATTNHNLYWLNLIQLLDSNRTARFKIWNIIYFFIVSPGQHIGLLAYSGPVLKTDANNTHPWNST